MRTLFYLLFLACLVPLVCFETFAELLMGYPKKLKRLQDAHQLVTRRPESHLGKPDITTLPGNSRGCDDQESFQGAAQFSGYHGSLDAPSWVSNRMCG